MEKQYPIAECNCKNCRLIKANERAYCRNLWRQAKNNDDEVISKVMKILLEGKIG